MPQVSPKMLPAFQIMPGLQATCQTDMGTPGLYRHHDVGSCSIFIYFIIIFITLISVQKQDAPFKEISTHHSDQMCVDMKVCHRKDVKIA